MFVRGDDTIFDVNDAFCEEFEIDEEILYDVDTKTMFFS